MDECCKLFCTREDLELADFCKLLPKAELHAHLNGSISTITLRRLVELKKKRCPCYHLTDSEELCIRKGHSRSLEQVFEMFKLVHNLTDTEDAITMATEEVIKDFAKDNVKYLELRTTPRSNDDSGLTKEAYVEMILAAIEKQSQKSQILVGVLLSIDRRHEVSQAEQTVDMALKYQNLSKNTVVGVELSGDPVYDGRKFLPCFRRARQNGLKISVHLAETPKHVHSETLDYLQLPADRIGHATYLRPEVGGSTVFVQELLRRKTPIEMCLSSNVKCKTVTSYNNHHMGNWLLKNHPVAICTDDKGVFDTTLTEEYILAADAFQLNRKELYQLSLQALNSAFISENQRSSLLVHWDDFRNRMFL